ncbi:thioredoxin-disulfide reductase [Pseudobacteriovorax antillogorgiicola]|uniref:Thioredoxin reductase n=1 Tax=Pseudobacteriovorax antillogorgiicola TaxID=1513793 RepID=A0A1Y6CHP9_9BACT|nr:thioredoxin-disulfide reductase [Pseudobacteriovorax antillogorgiicola]TCS46635.1 thioredoxin reductase (NADPH) [Pseudobacteriovorax antillogorgiicola]SMF66183.1 thioredoxin reductase (NADPH) [Pseudobacteriovorax antillogorgiicola]
MSQEIHDVVIVGTGPAGLTAAIYAARANLKPVIYAGIQHGGQLTITTDVENFPGFENGIMGPKLMQDMTAQAERFGTKIIYDSITRVELDGPVKKLWAGDDEIHAKSVIICTGATARTLGLEGEAQLMGRGLSTCATCDGFFYRNKKVAVVGGGDSAMEEATYLAKLCSEVILIHRRDVFRASPIMLKKAQNDPKITFKVPYETLETLSDDSGLTGVRIKHAETGETEDIELDGLFYAIGHNPNSELFSDYVDVDDHGYIVVKDFTKTKTPGVFAAGDIADPNFKQAITAAGMGCQAAIQAQHYVEALDA